MTEASATRLEEARADRPPTERPTIDAGNLAHLRPHEYGLRFAFGFGVSVVAGVAADLFGPRIGGLFLAFPAILPATLTLLEHKDGTAQATSAVRGAAIGGVGLMAFAAAAAGLIRTSAPLSLAAALAAWTASSGLLLLGLRLLVRVLGEKQYLPEIPIDEAVPLVALLGERGLTVATAESSTGGAVAALLGSVPDASRVLQGGIVAYTHERKQELLGVPAALLARDGSVSRDVALAMAHGARERLRADVGIGVTGLVGRPAEGRPAGLTFVAVEGPDGRTSVERFHKDYGPGRNDERAVRMALQLARRHLMSKPAGD